MNRGELPYRQSTLGLITNSNGKFLVVNKSLYQENQWSFPGGGVDKGETPKQALNRELQEELCSNKFEIVGQSRFPYIYEWPDDVIETAFQKYGQYFRGTQLTQFWVKYTGTPEEVQAGDGLKDIKWATREELKTHLIFPNQWENAEKVIREFT